jgi:hypothetical protein
MFTVLKRIENGEFVHVASRDDLQQALQLAQSLNVHWPGDYEVRDSRSEAIGFPSSANADARHRSPAASFPRPYRN